MNISVCGRGAHPQPLNFLHIGKTAGTQVTYVMSQLDLGKYQFIRQRHRVTLADIPQSEKYFFSIREPISRFYSGFYSRLRKGQPRYNIAWRPDEEVAFAHFQHANELAEALDPKHEKYQQALQAVAAIGHLRDPLETWFVGFDDVLKERPPVHIIRVDHFEEDLRTLLKRLKVKAWAEPSTDPIVAHKNDYSRATPLSEQAIKNLEKFLVQDIDLYNYFLGWKGFNRT